MFRTSSTTFNPCQPCRGVGGGGERSESSLPSSTAQRLCLGLTLPPARGRDALSPAGSKPGQGPSWHQELLALSPGSRGGLVRGGSGRPHSQPQGQPRPSSSASAASELGQGPQPRGAAAASSVKWAHGTLLPGAPVGLNDVGLALNSSYSFYWSWLRCPHLHVGERASGSLPDPVVTCFHSQGGERSPSGSLHGCAPVLRIN